MAAKKLRAVAPDEKPKPKKPANIKAAVDMQELVLLVAMRDKVAAEIDSGVPAHTLAPLMKQLRELDKEIRSIEAREAEQSEEPSSDDRGRADEAFDPASAI